MTTNQPSVNVMTKARKIFTESDPLYQNLMKKIMEIEREKMHLATRGNIHKALYTIIKDVIK